MVFSPVRLGILLALTCLAGMIIALQPQAEAQPYSSANLPSGVLDANVGGTTIDLQTSPTLTDPQPVISGQVQQSGGTVEITITSHPITFTANVAADGSFSQQVPEPIEQGQHSLYFGGALVGNFVMQASASTGDPTPAPPSTGSGEARGGVTGDRATTLFLAAAGGLLAAAGVALARHFRRRELS